jgi:hypothetical protein
MASDKKRQDNDTDRPLPLEEDVKRLKRDTGISESQAIALVHRFGRDQSAIRNAATKLTSFAK